MLLDHVERRQMPGSFGAAGAGPGSPCWIGGCNRITTASKLVMVKGRANAEGVRRDRGGILPGHRFHCSISLPRPTSRSGSKRNFRCDAWSAAEAPKACMQ